jgi:hypothetical protein
MPRYHLSIRHRGRLYHDDEGEEIAGEREVRDQALATVRDIMRTASLAVTNWMDCTLEVTDETGHIVLLLPFSDTVAEIS